LPAARARGETTRASGDFKHSTRYVGHPGGRPLSNVITLDAFGFTITT
jgi:hypothetical protein